MGVILLFGLLKDMRSPSGAISGIPEVPPNCAGDPRRNAKLGTDAQKDSHSELQGP